MPPKTCIASALTSQPASVPKALAIGVRNAARAAQSSSPVAVAMSIESAQSRQIARADRHRRRHRRQHPPHVGMAEDRRRRPRTGVRPCRRSRAKPSAACSAASACDSPSTPTPSRALFIIVNIAAMPCVLGSPISQPVAPSNSITQVGLPCRPILCSSDSARTRVRRARAPVGVGQELRHEEERDPPGARRRRPAAAPAPGGRRSRRCRGRPRR